MFGLSLLFGGVVFAALLLKVGIKDAQSEMRDEATPIGGMAWIFYTFALTLALLWIFRNIVWEFVSPKELNDNLLLTAVLFIPAILLIYKLSSEIAYYFVHGETLSAGDERQRKLRDSQKT